MQGYLQWQETSGRVLTAPRRRPLTPFRLSHLGGLLVIGTEVSGRIEPRAGKEGRGEGTGVGFESGTPGLMEANGLRRQGRGSGCRNVRNSPLWTVFQMPIPTVPPNLRYDEDAKRYTATRFTNERGDAYDPRSTPTVRPEQQMADPTPWGFHAEAGRRQEHPGLAAGASRACPAAAVAGRIAGNW